MIGITGANGFIGSYLAQHFAAAKRAPLRLLVRTAAAEQPQYGEICQGDLHSTADCERFADGLELIYYLAHTNTPVNSDLDQPNDVLLNLVPFLNLLQAVGRLGTKPHIVYFSSGGAVYARSAERVPFREGDPCSPSCSYGILKLAAEHYLRLATQRGFLTATVLRVGNAYGTLLPRHRMQGLIGVALSNLSNGTPIRVFGDRSNVRDYIHLKDLCILAERVGQARECFDIVNAGSGQGHSVADVLDIIQECHGRPLQLFVNESQGRWLTDWAVLDIAKAGAGYGWRPAVTLRSGIGAMLSAWPAEFAPAAQPNR